MTVAANTLNGALGQVIAGLLLLALGGIAGVYRTLKSTQVENQKVKSDAVEAARQSSLAALQLALEEQRKQTLEARLHAEEVRKEAEKHYLELASLRERVAIIEEERSSLQERVIFLERIVNLRKEGGGKGDPETGTERRSG